MKLVVLLFSSLPVVVHGLPYQQVPLGYPTFRQTPLDESFDKLAEHALKEFNVPGFSIAVVKGNETFAKGYGVAELPDTKASADTLYFTGSTTKSFTAASILKLIAESKNSTHQLSLQTKISNLIPWKLQDDYVRSHATLEDALSHRTGMPRHDMAYGGPNYTATDLIDAMQYLPLTKEIRQEWQYCNMMYLVLSQIVETLSGTALSKFFQTNIWDPLGMSNTFMDMDAAKKTSNLAKGYYYDNSTAKYLAHDYVDPEFVSGAGGIISSVSDYAIYLRAMLQKDLAILDPVSFAELRKARMLIGPMFGPDPIFTGPNSYGLGKQNLAHPSESVTTQSLSQR